MTTEAWNLDATKPEKPFPHPALECHPDGISEEVNTALEPEIEPWLRMRYVKLQVEALSYCCKDFRQDRARAIFLDIQDILDGAK